MTPLLFLIPAGNTFGATAVVGIAAGSLVTMLLARRFCRELERRADSVAHANEGQEGVYGRALARLYEDNLMPAVQAGRAPTHPDLYDRLLALGIQPSFPRPKPPSANALHGRLMAALLGVLLFVTLMRLYP